MRIFDFVDAFQQYGCTLGLVEIGGKWTVEIQRASDHTILAYATGLASYEEALEIGRIAAEAHELAGRRDAAEVRS